MSSHAGPLAHDNLPPVTIDRTLAATPRPVIKARDYWLALRGEREMPAREEILPRDMRDFLAHVGLVEAMQLPDGSEDYAMRLMGGRIEEVFGAISKKPICEVLPPAIAARWRAVFDEVRNHRQPLVLTGRVAHENLRHLKYELFAAPLGEGANDDVPMIFGVLDLWAVT